MDTLLLVTMFIKSTIFNKKNHISFLKQILAFSFSTILMAGSALATDSYIGSTERIMFAIGETPATCFETELGNFTADAVRYFTSADISIIDGGVFKGNLPGGEITASEINALFYEDEVIYNSLISPAQLKMLLEDCVANTCVGEDEQIDVMRSASPIFPQVSGFSFKYDVSAPAGDRIQWIKLEDGTELVLTDSDPYISISAPANILKSFTEPSVITLSESVASYIKAGHSSVPELGRIISIGYNEPIVGKYVSRFSIFILGLVFFVTAIITPRKQVCDEDDIVRKVFPWK